MLAIVRLFIICFCVTIIGSKIIKESNFVTVAIVGTNDIHGTAMPSTLFRSDTGQTYHYGGLQYMASMIETIRKQYEGNFLYLDAGDQFQGGIQSSPLVSSGEIMNNFFNEVGLDSSAIGNHQFDFGTSFLFPYWLNRKDSSWNLAANLKSETGEQEFLPKHKNVWLYTLDSGIKIGVIGLATVETPSTTSAFKDGSFPKYSFLNYSKIVIEKSKLLRSQGAHAVVLLSHVGNYCDSDSTYGLWFEGSKNSGTCKDDDEMSELLKSIPSGTVDGVVQGHRHSFSHHYIERIPVMGTINGGYYFNVLYLKFCNQQLHERFIEGPIPVCQKLFQNTRNCNYQEKELLADAGQLREWKFHGVKVEAHPQVQRLFDTKWLPKMKQFLQPLVLNEVFLQRKFGQESQLGNLATDLLDMAFPDNDFVLINEGGFRTIWYPGVLQYQHFFSMFPFDNTAVSFQITGEELIKTLEVIQSGLRAFYPTKKLRQSITIYQNGTKKLTNVTFSSGELIDPKRNYKGISLDFLLYGGDDFNKVINKIYTVRNRKVLGPFRQSLKPQLIKMQKLTQQKVHDPENPRLILDYI